MEMETRQRELKTFIDNNLNFFKKDFVTSAETL